MVDGLAAQQQALLQQRVTTSDIRVQQEALQRGIPVGQILRERESERLRKESEARIKAQKEAQIKARQEAEAKAKEAAKKEAASGESAAVLGEARRILRGRPPSGDKQLLNKALELIAARPDLRRVLEGGAPLGLSTERQEQFRIGEAKRLDLELGTKIEEAKRLGIDLPTKEIIKEKQEAAVKLQQKLLGQPETGIVIQPVDLSQIQSEFKDVSITPFGDVGGRGMVDFVGEVQVAPEPIGGIEKGLVFLQRKRGEAFTERARGEETFGTQFLGGAPGQIGVSILETFQFGKEFIEKPVETTKQIPSGVFRAIQEVPDLGRLIREEPGVVGAGIIVGVVGLKGISNVFRSTIRASTKAVQTTAKTKIPNKVVQSVDVSDALLIRTLPDGSKVFDVQGKVITKVVNVKTGKTIQNIATDVVSRIQTSPTKNGAIRAFVDATSQSIRDTARRTSQVEPKVTISGTLQRTRGVVEFIPKEEGAGFIGVGGFESVEVGRITGRLTPKELQVQLIRTRTPQITKTPSVSDITFLGEDFVVKKIGGVEVLGRRTVAETAAFGVTFPQKVKVSPFLRVRQPEKGALFGIERVPTRTRKFPKRPKGKPQIVREIDLSRGVGTAFEPLEIIANLDKLTEGVIKPRRPPVKPKVTKAPKVAEAPKTQGDILEQALTGTDEGLIGGALGQEVVSVIAKEVKVKAVKPRVTKVKPVTKDITKVDTRLGALTLTDITQTQEQIQKGRQKQEPIFGQGQFQQPIVEVTTQQDVFTKQDFIPIQINLQKLSSAVDFTQPSAFVPGFVQPPRPILRPPRIITPPPIILPDFDKDPIIEKIRKSNKPHDVFVKRKKRKRKIADNVMGDVALDLGSFVTDRALAAEFSIKEDKGKIKKPPFQPPKNYWDFNKNKFRQFRIKQGRQIPLKNTFIERKNRRLDTQGERLGITTARLLANQRKQQVELKRVSKDFGDIFAMPRQSKKKTQTKRVKRQKNVFNMSFDLS